MQIPGHLINEHYDDRYFDVVDAIEEAKQIFFEGNRLLDRLSAPSNGEKTLTIGETGFGAGRTMVALVDYLDKSGISGVAVRIYSVELHPVTVLRMQEILGGFRDRAAAIIDALVGEYAGLDLCQTGWHRFGLLRPFGSLTINLWAGEALDMVVALPVCCDAWFLDGHCPRKNPAMWRPELLEAIGEKTVPGGTCATYTVAGMVRRGLGAAGFGVEKVPGFGGKSAALRGVRLPTR
jgi:tRNA U34 5-methylaminomethyl-2-thiouridine-forming methyltransferase MnmC